MDQTIEKKIEQLICSDVFGSGTISTDAYNTAWVARIPSKADRNRPEFPECIEFLRNSQNLDGSWGSNHPFSLFDRLISTLIVITCFKQWSFPLDTQTIVKGQKFLVTNLKLLKRVEDVKNTMTIAFELLLPSLIDEAKEMGLTYGSDDIIQGYRIERQRKIDTIKACMKQNNEISRKKTWHFSLEGLDGLHTNEEIEKMFSHNGLICASYAPTAFALYKGLNSPRSLEHIRDVVAETKGPIYSFAKCPLFEIAWSYIYLYYSGYKLDHKYLQGHIDTLYEHFNENDGLVGASLLLPPDADDTASVLLALSLANKLKDRSSLNGMLKFLKGNCFITHEAENTVSLSTNLNCLLAMINYQKFDEISQISKEVAIWTRKFIEENNHKFEDKWHSSRIYPMSRALIAFGFYDFKFSRKIFEIVESLQNSDGGWGSQGHSSRLETSYAIISMTYWLRIYEKDIDDKSKPCLRRANEFMKEKRNEVDHKFWIAKLLYSQINLDKITILSGEFALNFFLNSFF